MYLLLCYTKFCAKILTQNVRQSELYVADTYHMCMYSNVTLKATGLIEYVAPCKSPESH